MRPDPDAMEFDLEKIAYQIGKVIAAKHIFQDRHLDRMDGLAKASATHTMALGMVETLKAEAEAALDEVRRQLREQGFRDLEECMACSDGPDP